MPSATETELEACPAIKASCPLSRGLGKPERPPYWRRVRKLLTPAGQNLMGVALMAHVEHQPVSRRVEHAVDGHRQLDRAEVGGQMPARLSTRLSARNSRSSVHRSCVCESFSGLDVAGDHGWFQESIRFRSFHRDKMQHRHAPAPPGKRHPVLLFMAIVFADAPCRRWSMPEMSAVTTVDTTMLRQLEVCFAAARR